jgi:hypothetical protein
MGLHEMMKHNLIGSAKQVPQTPQSVACPHACIAIWLPIRMDAHPMLLQDSHLSLNMANDCTIGSHV